MKTVTRTKEQKRQHVKGCLLPVMFCLILPVGFLLNVRYHDWQLWRLSRSLFALQHPSNTTKVQTLKYVGNNVMGTGDQIDYFVAETRAYSGSKEKVRSFYANRTIPNPINGQMQKIVVVFVDDSDDKAQNLADMDEINNWKLFPPSTPKANYGEVFSSNAPNLYVIYVHDGGYIQGFDLDSRTSRQTALPGRPFGIAYNSSGSHR